MTTTTQQNRPARASDTGPVRSVVARRVLAVLRIAFGFYFLWAFLDKTFGLGFATPAERAWIRGGDPTFGYLSNTPAGPFAGFYKSLAGNPLISWLFMIALLAIGLALILGIGLRIAGVAGALLYVMMWSVALPPTTNPFLDTHLTGALTLVLFAVTNAGDTWGLGRWWNNLPFVAKNQWLR